MTLLNFSMVRALFYIFILSLFYLSKSLCPATGIWPETESGTIRTVYCTDEYRYVGNLQRECKNEDTAQWGSVVDNCVLGSPYNLTYPYSTIRVYEGYPISSISPLFRGKGESFSSEPDLPEGLSLNEQTGEISGSGLSKKEGCVSVRIDLHNEVGSCSTELSVCTILTKKEKDNRLGDSPKPMFWYFLSGSIILLTLTIVLSIPYCICQSRRNKRNRMESE